MRRINKFKIFSKFRSKSLPGRIYTKLLNFKRPKWLPIKKKIYTLRKRANFFKNCELQPIRYKSWTRVNKYFSRGLEIKRALSFLFDNSKNFYSLKKEGSIIFSKKKFLFSFFVKNEFRADLLLWNLNICSSRFSARNLINCGKILVNGKVSKPNRHLLKGDIISFPDFTNVSNFQRTWVSFEQSKKVFSFVEVDYYLGNFVIIKDFSELSYEDSALLLLESWDIKNLALNI